MDILEVEKLGKMLNESRIPSLVSRSFLPAEIVHSGNKATLYDLEINDDIDSGLENIEAMQESIDKWIIYLNRIRDEADRISNAATKLYNT